jgi:uncharacterized protein DUF4349
MQTEFEFLRRFERDLAGVARAEQQRLAAEPSPKRSHHWRGWAAAAASLLAVAGLIGLAIQGSNGGAASMQFSSVGAAVNEPRPPVPGTADMPDVGGASSITHEQAGNMAGYTGLKQATSTGEQQQTPAGTPSGPAITDLSKIIRDGQVAVTIDDGSFSARSLQVSRIAVANHGSILSSSTSGGDSGTFTLRIPAANFERALNQLSKLGTVDSSEVHGQDVTAQYVDLKAHMKIYLSRRKVLFGLMAQANSIGETLTIQRQLDDVQLKIDQIQGQLNFINKQVAESTIKVDLHEPDAAVATPASDVENPSIGRAWDHAVQGFLNVLAAVLIGLGYLIPIGVVVAIGYGIVLLVKRGRSATTDES